ncbi:MAG: 50S ribosome-binding GTPase, partial [Terrimicrobiaceae bacterium]|nr:50S ribosome-binding GTPase [Terrimicrobiaceae bacterium]
LTQAEAVMDLIRARTPASLRAAREQMDGELGRLAGELRSQLLALVAHLEAWIDFPEEGIDPDAGGAIARGFREVIARVESLLETARSGRIYREGASLVLWGEPNAGKSSLLNRLLGCERAIVDPSPGTTRDTIEESLMLGGFLFRVTDTAGVREGGGAVERQGIERTHKALEGADVALQVVDATRSTEPLARPVACPAPGLVVWNKCDLLPEWPSELPEGICAISCLTGRGLSELSTAILRQAGLNPSRPAAAAINARHQNCLRRVRDALERALADLEAGQPAEFAASSAREALDAAGEMTGAADAEEILGEIFSRFCIGK